MSAENKKDEHIYDYQKLSHSIFGTSFANLISAHFLTRLEWNAFACAALITKLKATHVVVQTLLAISYKIVSVSLSD